MLTPGQQTVTILGLAIPPGDQMELLVREDPLGVSDRFPRFRYPGSSDIDVCYSLSIVH